MLYAGDEVYGDDVTSGDYATGQSFICHDCGERWDEDAPHQGCCAHEDIDPALGYAGDPAREDPHRGTCTRCQATLVATPEGWEIE